MALLYGRAGRLTALFGGFPARVVGLFFDEEEDAKSSGSNNVRALKIVRMFRLTKMLRLLRMKSLVEKYDDSVQQLINFLTYVKAVFFILYVGHVAACLWYYFGQNKQVQHAVEHAFIVFPL
jgi:hypothetical protein